MSISPLAKRGFTLSTLSAACLMAFNAQAADCSNLEEWTAQGVFTGGTQVQFDGSAYQASWWTQNNNPAERSGPWQEWKLLGQCEGVVPTVEPTAEPTPVPTAEPTPVPTAEPTPVPTAEPTPVPTAEPTPVPTAEPTPVPTAEPTPVPTAEPTPVPTAEPTPVPTAEPTPVPTVEPTLPPVGDASCKPAGLYQTPGVNTPYCTIYDADGREDMGADHPRRIIGYFTSWRNGANGQPSFLASDVPWDSLTHINYAFAHINKQGEVSVGDVNDPNNPATGMTWDGAENAMDPSLPYKGHFNLLNQYAKKHDVKLLLSVGGWAETGAHFDDKGRYMDGGFYSLTIKPDGSINHEAIAKFAKSAAKFVDTYDFDGIDIDYEYPSSMSDAGHPEDWSISNQHRGKLWGGYMALMEALRAELDKQGEKDAQHYMLTIASPSSGYLLRGFEGFQALKYLDYVNIMSYDLHGAWNHFVGHNAALYDNGVDNEIADAGIYSGNDAKYYNSQGYLNIDWSYKYFRNALAGGRINIGLPYYTRGWQQVQGGTNGYNGLAALANQKECYLGTGGNLGPDALSPKAGAPCGLGAQGIENLWYDLGPDGKEMFAGVNPIWHVENLKQGLPTPYVSIYGHDTSKPEGQASGNYVEHYDEVAQASWLWNEEKGVFLSTENMKSYQAKVQYAIDQGAGGIMFWEMAGDYSTPEQNGLGHYYFGSTLTDKAYEMIKTAAPYGIEAGDENFPAATETVDVDVDLVGYLPKGEDNYPIQIALKLTNNSNVDLSGAKIAFNASPAVPMNAQISDTLKPYAVPAGPGITNLVDMYSGAKWSVEKIATSGLTPGNAGGLSDDFHRFAVQLKAEGWGSVEWKPGQTIDVAMRIYMPMPVPTNFTFEVGGKTYGRTAEQPNVPVAGGDNGTTPTPSGEPTPAPSGEPTVPSDVTPFVPGTAVKNGAVVSYNGACYQAKNNPGAWETPAAGGNWFWDVVTCP
ncbi:chitinase C-terminal domain-containing protein [Motilimonas cestriensis]|uniref:Chitinase C-terminal domain-containing protein n=1 Tax=Motilimonas cestriensis TaxID=2742685 RepID=A0ABS8W6S4_9GAMM|nr:glycosyl hydrolase family 18 protein [Motilimonas cestriensis]MCE2594712.1 chitinase C-terminal domain-containing protein [Motilimonas cestriensis]